MSPLPLTNFPLPPPTWAVSSFNFVHHLTTKYSTAFHILSFIVGVVVLLFGYFILPSVLFLSGALLGTIIFDVIMTSNGETSQLFKILILIGGAFISGFIATRLLSSGLFAIGAITGLLLSSTFLPKLSQQHQDAHAQFSLISLTIATLLGLLTVIFQKPFIITTTSIAGSIAVVFSIAFFVHVDDPFALTGQNSISPKLEIGPPGGQGANNLDIPRISCLAAFVLFTFVGIQTQYWLAKHYCVEPTLNNQFDPRHRRRAGYQNLPNSSE